MRGYIKKKKYAPLNSQHAIFENVSECNTATNNILDIKCWHK